MCLAYLKDCNRYFRHSDLSCRQPSNAGREAEAIRLVHSLEKGLVMPPPRRRFGDEACARLSESLPAILADSNLAWLVDYGNSVMNSVKVVNRSNGVHDGHKLLRGCIELTREEILRSRPNDPAGFFRTRHSVRSFTGPPLTDHELISLVEGAQTAPSVCNRQGARIRFYNETNVKAEILSLQNGNRGFGHLIPTVAVISCDLRIFIGYGERNQAWIDGGLFAMTLALVAHAQGLGTCFLNWSVVPERDRLLRQLLAIPDHEVIITLLGIGAIEERLFVAESRRRPLQSVWLNAGEALPVSPHADQRQTPPEEVGIH